ncbi:ribonuclease D [Synechococcus elongatus]|uniref:Ribonuclease D n=1 Tax=Synechococcus elongatus PCC 11801 TaxID=2219813 RepID=A0AAN1UVA9_SYNEL|nr:ribonuclease D [Synechococcus elongatus]AZB73491.1 ribonuclease D [Synechococcus elongatus PCC 11801]
MSSPSQDFYLCEEDLTDELLAQYRQSSAIAIDTEAMGLNFHRDRLCLVQLCDATGITACVRIAQGQTAAPNLKALCEESQITKVFHFARFDITALKHGLGIAVQPIFCTKIASKLARTYSSQHGLKSLLQELLGVELDKTAQSSDWGNAAALSAEQLRYACNDVRYLLAAQKILTTMLQREGRWQLAQDCFACLPTFAALDLAQFGSVFEH